MSKRRQRSRASGQTGGRIWRETVVSIGLTGGIGSGKSLALEVFEALGAITISADAVVHGAYGLPEVRAAVVGRLGNRVRRPDGTIDRHAVAARVFSRPADLEFLESILHPIVRRRLVDTVAAAPDGRVMVAEVPLLFEAGWTDLFDVTIALGAETRVRHERTEHLFSDMDFAIREALQLTDERRQELAHYSYTNQGTKADLAAWAAMVFEQVRRDYLGDPENGSALQGERTVVAVDIVAAAEAEALCARAAGSPLPARLLGEVFEDLDGQPRAQDLAWEYLPPGAKLPERGFEKGRGETLVILRGDAQLLLPDGGVQHVGPGTAVLLAAGCLCRLENRDGTEPVVLLRLAPR